MRKKTLIGILFLLISILLLRPVLSQGKDPFKDSYNRASSMLVAGKFDDAIQNYTNALTYNPNSSEAYLGLGIAYKESGKYQEAYNSITKALSLNPNYYQAYYNLGIVLENMGRTEEAIKAYDRFLEKVDGAERFSDAKQRLYKLKKKS